MLGTSHCIERKGNFICQRAIQSSRPGWASRLRLPALVASFLGHTQHMVDIPYTVGLVTQETPHTAQAPRVAGSKTVPAREKVGAEQQEHLLCWLKHDVTNRNKAGLILGTVGELSQWPGDERPFPWLRVCKEGRGGLEPLRCARLGEVLSCSVHMPRSPDRMNPRSDAAGAPGEALPRQD